MVLVLSVLGSYVLVMSDEVNLTATIPPGYALQDYLCSGPLKSNTTVVLDDGEHRISSGPPCDIFNVSSITITGSSMKNTTVCCEGEGRVLRFSSLQNFTLERMTFISCCIQLVSIKNTVIFNCTFQSCSMGQGAIWSQSSTNIDIASCVFQNNGNRGGATSSIIGDETFHLFGDEGFPLIGGHGQDGGAVKLKRSTGNVSITNCTFQNNSASGSSTVSLDVSQGDVSITYCTFQNNSASGSGTVSLDVSKGNVSITYCTFQNNSASGSGAVWLHTSQCHVSITNCSFQNNSATVSCGAVCLSESTGNASITNCTFQNNSAKSGGGAVILESLGHVSITNCTFQNNSVTYGNDDGGALQVGSSGDVSIINCTFQNNGATYGGAVKLYGSQGNVDITSCTFQNNSATYGGAVKLYGSTVNVVITSCTFHNNTAANDGGAVELDGSQGNVVITNCTFTKNSAHNGAALYVTKLNIFYNVVVEREPLVHLLLQDVVIKDNHCSGGGAIYFDGVNVDIFGNTPTGSQFSSNSAQGAIQGQNGLLHLHGNIKFAENRGVNGGAISLSNNVPLYFYEGCRVEFTRNVATGVGGAIYNDWGQKYTKHLKLCIIRFIITYGFYFKSLSIICTDNHAQQGGHAVYATPIYDCELACFDRGNESQCFVKEVTTCITITSLPEDINDTQVLSSPAHVRLCGCSDPKLCNVTSQYQGKVTTYPGGTVRLNVTSVDDGNNLSPSVVYTQIDTSAITSPNIALGPRQEAQWIQIVCGTIEYQIYGPEMASFKLLLSNNPDNSPAVIEVELLSCEPGFILSSTGVIKCNCSLFFTSLGVVCDTSDGTACD